METFLIISAILLMIAGIAGCFLPVLPGPPVAYIGLLVLHFTKAVEFSATFLVTWAVLVVVVVILENLIPVWGAKKFGGTKAGMWGAAIGCIIGAFIIPPIGLIGGTLLGAFVGEMIANPGDIEAALKSAIGALIGFAVGIALKLSVTLVMTFYFVKELWVVWS